MKTLLTRLLNFGFLTLLFPAMLALPARAQAPAGVTIGAATAADASAALDIISADKGALLPRLTEAARLAMGAGAVPPPAAGLIVYQTDGSRPGFWYNQGSSAAPQWLRLTDSNGVSYSPGAGLQVGPGPVGASIGGNVPGQNGGYNGPFRGGSASARTETLYPAAYLLALGLRPGPITSISYRMSIKASSGPYPGFTLALGHSPAAGLGTAFTGSGLTPVFSGSVSTPAAGELLTLAFNGSPFVWDGSSGLLVQTCFEGNVPSADDGVYGNSVPNSRVFAAGASSQCAEAAGTASNNRPAVAFGQPAGAYTLPAVAGSAGQVLTQQASGAVAFQDPQWTQAGASLFATNAASNVGIGTTSPAEKLDVNGNQRLTGTLQLNTGDSDKILLTNQGAAGSKIGHAAGWGVLHYAGPGTSTTGYYSWLSSTPTGYAEQMRLSSSGRLGLGTSTPFSRLANTASNIVGADGIGGNSGSLAWAVSQQGYAGQFFNEDSDGAGLAVKVASTTAGALDVSRQAGVSTPGVSLLRVRGDGNVGIGTTSPAQKLDVNGNARVSGTIQTNSADGDKIFLTAQGAAGSKIGHAAGGGVLSYAGPGTSATGYQAWLTSTPTGYAERMRLTTTGALGLGTSTPVSQLSNTASNVVAADGIGGGASSLIWAVSQQGYAGQFFNGQANGGGLAVRVASTTASAFDISQQAAAGTAGTSLLNVKANGRVGISMGSPQGRLHVVNDGGGGGFVDDYLFDEYGPGDQTIYMRRSGGTLAAPTNLAPGTMLGRLAFVPRANNNLGYQPGAHLLSAYRGDGTTNQADLQLWTSNVERLRITEAGNVGIGLAAPAAKLDVNGSQVVRGTLQVSTGDGDKILLTNQGAAGSKIGHATGWGVLHYAGPGTGATGYHAWLTSTPTGYAERLRLTTAGALGLGTTAPRGRLDVAGGDTYLVADPNAGSAQNAFLPGHLYLAPYNGSTGPAFIQARVPNPTAATNLSLVLRTTNAGALVNALTLNANGSAVFAGSVTATSFSPSDARLKQDIRPLTGALAAVQALRGVRYTYRQHLPGRPLPAGEQVGVLAQEVEKLYPELVSTDAQGYKAVNYAQLTPVLIEAIKEQQRELEALRAAAATSQARAAQVQAAQQADHAALLVLQAQVSRLLSQQPTAAGH